MGAASRHSHLFAQLSWRVDARVVYTSAALSNERRALGYLAQRHHELAAITTTPAMLGAAAPGRLCPEWSEAVDNGVP